MACNLRSNVKSASKNQNVRSATGWADSNVVLYWLNRQGSYNQVVRNRVNKVLEGNDIDWQYVPTRDNPADLSSRRSLLTEIQIFGGKILLGQSLKKTGRSNQTKPSVQSAKKKLRFQKNISLLSSQQLKFKMILIFYCTNSIYTKPSEYQI